MNENCSNKPTSLMNRKISIGSFLPNNRQNSKNDLSLNKGKRTLYTRMTGYSQRAAGNSIQYCFSLLPGSKASHMMQHRVGHALIQSLFFESSTKNLFDKNLTIKWPKNEEFDHCQCVVNKFEQLLMFEDFKSMVNNSSCVPLTAFLNFLLSYTDKSNYLFFYIITEDFIKKKTDRIDLQRWAYEIHSTFTLNDGSPMFINISDVEQHQISRVLQGAELTKVDESNLRHVFDRSREYCSTFIEEKLLPQFNHHRKLGILSFYDDELVQNHSDRLQQIEFLEFIMAPYIEKYKTKDANMERENNLTTSCIASFLRHYDVKRSSRFDLSDINVFLRREGSTIFTKGKKMTKKLKEKQLVVNGHCLTPRHFIKATQCSICSQYLYGIAPQGYFCINCEMAFNEECVRNGSINRLNSNCNYFNKKSKSSAKLVTKNSYYNGSSSQGQSNSLEGRHSFSIGTRDIPRMDSSNVQRSKSDKWHRDKVGKSNELQIFDNDQNSYDNLMMNDAGISESNSKHIYRTYSNTSKLDKSSHGSQGNYYIEKSNVASLTSVNESTESDNFDIWNEDDGLEDDSDTQLDGNHLPSLESFLDSEQLKNLSEKELQKQAVLLELYHTERTHLKSLKIMRVIYRDKMQHLQCISSDELFIIFPNLDELIIMHTQIKKALRECIEKFKDDDTFSISDVLLNHFSGKFGQKMANECAKFIEKQALAIIIINQKENTPEFIHFLRTAEINPICKKLHLKDYLHCVMSRVLKYKLLFDQLYKFSEDPHEKSIFGECMRASEELNMNINESIRTRELEDLILKIKQDLFINMPDFDELTYDIRKGEFDFDSRELIYNSVLTFEWPLKDIEFEACLFSDALVLFQRIPLTSNSQMNSEYRYVLQNHRFKREHNEMEIVISPYMPIEQFMLKKKAGPDNCVFFLVSKGKNHQFLIELRAGCKDERDRWFSHVNRCQENAAKQLENYDYEEFLNNEDMFVSSTDLHIIEESTCRDVNTKTLKTTLNISNDIDDIITRNCTIGEILAKLRICVHDPEAFNEACKNINQEIVNLGIQMEKLKLIHDLSVGNEASILPVNNTEQINIPENCSK